MDLNFLKNPIILAIIAIALTYAYMYWENKKKREEPDASVTAVLEQTKPTQQGGVNLLEGNPLAHKSRISERMTDTFGSNTYHLVGKNAIRLPQTDVFIDIAKF